MHHCLDKMAQESSKQAAFENLLLEFLREMSLTSRKAKLLGVAGGEEENTASGDQETHQPITADTEKRIKEGWDETCIDPYLIFLFSKNVFFTINQVNVSFKDAIVDGFISFVAKWRGKVPAQLTASVCDFTFSQTSA